MTTENNKLIAEFMGNRNYLYNNDKSAMYFILTNTAGEELIVNYNNDWGLLMEVVEKIFNTCEVTPNNLDCEWDILFKQIHNSFYCPKIEAVYNACVEFIKWYNQQKQ